MMGTAAVGAATTWLAGGGGGGHNDRAPSPRTATQTQTGARQVSGFLESGVFLLAQGPVDNGLDTRACVGERRRRDVGLLVQDRRRCIDLGVERQGAGDTPVGECPP